MVKSVRFSQTSQDGAAAQATKSRPQRLVFTIFRSVISQMFFLTHKHSSHPSARYMNAHTRADPPPSDPLPPVVVNRVSILDSFLFFSPYRSVFHPIYLSLHSHPAHFGSNITQSLKKNQANRNKENSTQTHTHTHTQAEGTSQFPSLPLALLPGVWLACHLKNKSPSGYRVVIVLGWFLRSCSLYYWMYLFLFVFPQFSCTVCVCECVCACVCVCVCVCVCTLKPISLCSARHLLAFLQWLDLSRLVAACHRRALCELTSCHCMLLFLTSILLFSSSIIHGGCRPLFSA